MAEQLYGIAVGTMLPAAKACSEVESWMTRLGFSEPPGSYDRDGEYRRYRVFPRIDGGAWIVLEDQKRSSLPWAVGLARHLGARLDVLEVSAFDVPKQAPDGDFAYQLAVQAVSVGPDGQLGPPSVEPSDESSPLLRSHGDFYETVSGVLNELADGALPPTSEGCIELDLYRRARSSGLSDRLTGIVDSLEAASAVSLMELEGNQFLRIEAADGSSRMARVSGEELETLRRFNHLKVPN